MCTIECGAVDAYVASVELASRWGRARGPREAISHITMEVGSRASAASKGLGGKWRQRRAPWCGASEANGHNSCSLIPECNRPRNLPFLNSSTSASRGCIDKISVLNGSVPSMHRFTRNPILSPLPNPGRAFGCPEGALREP
mmetsp:Transcript_52009/g.84029  ORF Transcript_52009/g.84029 Transcript_52009/m.84029 type:complete len:142 (-) Transcript_52009:769-1194(-)